MELNQSDLITLLRNFLEVTKYQSVSKAASLNGISQSAMTKRMERLCKALNIDKLYNFEHRQMFLTDEGYELRLSAVKIIKAFDELFNKFNLPNNVPVDKNPYKSQNDNSYDSDLDKMYKLSKE